MGDATYSEFTELYDESFNAWSPFWEEAEDDLRFYAGDQWSQAEADKLREEGRTALVINRSATVIDMVAGYQRQHRTSSVVSPIGDEDQESADEHSKVLLFNEQTSNAYMMLSDAFSGALRSGWNVLTVFKDYRRDQEDGDIAIVREPYNAFLCDPYFSSTDWSDCGYVMKRRYMHPTQAASLYAKHSDLVFELAAKDQFRDGKFGWLPYAPITESSQNVVAVTEMWRQEWESKPYLLDKMTNRQWDWTENPDLYSEVMRRHPDAFSKIDNQVRRVRRDLMINDVAVETKYNPCGLNEYPFVPVICKFIPEIDDWSLRIQSLQRAMKDPQRETNRRRSQYIDIIESSINTGFIAVEDTVINKDALYQTGQNKVIYRRKGTTPDMLQQIPPPQIPPGHFQAQAQFDQDIMEVAGVNDAAFGRAEVANESGIATLIRQSAALVNLQEVMDRLRGSQKLLAQKFIKLAQTWSPEKVARILGKPPSEKFYDPELSRYDIVVQEGTLTDTQRQAYFKQLLELNQMGVPVPPQELIRAAPIQGKGELTKAIEQQSKQAAEEAAKAAKIERDLVESQAMLAQSQSMANMASAEERYARAESNRGLQDERQSRAVQQEMDAALKQIEAVRKLQGIDFDNAMRALQFIRDLQETIASQAEVRSAEEEQRTVFDQESNRQALEQGSRQLQSAGGIPEESQEEGQIGLPGGV